MNSNLGKLPTMIDFGQFTLTGTGSIVRQTFSFNKTFPSTPKIFFGIQRNSSTNLLEADIMTISADTKSCYYAFKGTNACSHIIHWLAVC